MVDQSEPKLEPENSHMSGGEGEGEAEEEFDQDDWDNYGEEEENEFGELVAEATK